MWVVVPCPVRVTILCSVFSFVSSLDVAFPAGFEMSEC